MYEGERAIVQILRYEIFGMWCELFREIEASRWDAAFSATHKRDIILDRSLSRAHNRGIMSRRSRARIPPRRGWCWVTSCMPIRGNRERRLSPALHIFGRIFRYATRSCDRMPIIIYGKYWQNKKKKKIIFINHFQAFNNWIF